MSQPGLHYHVAEQGKLHALKGEHAEALRHYREALRLAAQHGEPEVCMRHYAWCVLESLERSGALEDVLALCQRVEAHYAQHPPTTELARLDRAAHQERQGLALAKRGRTAMAREQLEAAVGLAGAGRLPLAERVLGWLRGGLHVDARRLALEQEQHRYWTVRPEAVNPSIAVPLPSLAGPR
jgi:tetratricopeptide (TPR) repeat protein